MEVVEIASLKKFYAGRRVLVTGHTGFKGAWLSLWLESLGAKVSGVALPPEPGRLYERARVGELVESRTRDIRDADGLEGEFAALKPQLVFHLAAQPLVRLSYKRAAETFAVNVQGTVNTLEAARKAGADQIVVITTDKVYENAQPERPCREGDPLGGRDPYSASKACADIAAASYARSFPQLAVAVARAGNVIGGGDWAEDRLIPDCVRALEAGAALTIRSPRSVRPWQHVLEPLSGYLMLAERLAADPKRFGGAWNFGPDAGEELPVDDVVRETLAAWGAPEHPVRNGFEGPYESPELRLDSSKAKAELGWKPAFGTRRAIRESVSWYKAVAAGADARVECRRQIDEFSSAPAAHG